MKYIMLVNEEGRHLPIIFPEELIHKEVYQAVSRIRTVHPFMPRSAGFTQLMVLNADGESETLGIKSHPQDAMLINNHGYDKGMLTPLSERVHDMVRMRSVELMLKVLEGKG